MLLPINLQKDCTQNAEGYQLKSQSVEAMDLTDLYSTRERINSVSPRTLLMVTGL